MGKRAWHGLIGWHNADARLPTRTGRADLPIPTILSDEGS